MRSFDTPLVEAATRGDHAALIGLIRLARPDIRRYARSACRTDDIEDAVQETLWLLYRQIGTLRAVSSLSAWLFAVVRRECLRLGRATRLIGENVLDKNTQFFTQGDDDLRLDLADAIQSLPEHYRVVVVMRDLEERTVDEIAAAMSLSREAVKGRLHRARLLLREYLLG